VEKIIEAADKQVKAVFKIAAGCRLGEHALRIRAAAECRRSGFFTSVRFLPSKKRNRINDRKCPIRPAEFPPCKARSEARTWISFRSMQSKANVSRSRIEGARLGRTMFDPYIAIEDVGGSRTRCIR